MNAPTLKVDNVRTHFFTRQGVVRAVDGVSFEVGPGRILGLVGESGSGKTMTGFSIMGLVDPPGRIVEGRILLQGRDLRALSASRQELSRVARRLAGHRRVLRFDVPNSLCHYAASGGIPRFSAGRPISGLLGMQRRWLMGHSFSPARAFLERRCGVPGTPGVSRWERQSGNGREENHHRSTG